MGQIKIGILSALVLLLGSCNEPTRESNTMVYENMLVRIAKIELLPGHFEEYLDLLREEASASMELEAGVICIYPMYEKDNPSMIRLLEIYADREAYESHLKTPHFLKYKNGTLHMIKSLELLDMEAIDPQTMPAIFSKLAP